MGSQVIEEPLQLRWRASRPIPPDQHAKARPKLSVNALMGMGLWTLLWLGYNTNFDFLENPTTTGDLIHGVRAFFPIAAAWIAGLVIVARLKRLLPWLLGPLGLMLLYTVMGLASSATLSLNPDYALYYGANYLAIVLVLLAVVLVDDPLQDLRNVLRSTWAVGTLITLSLLGAIPFLGARAVIAPEDASLVRMRAYGGQVDEFMGMMGTRNTGFARYAGITALVALPGILRKGHPIFRAIWGCVFAASLYALIIANGRTETLAFVAGVLLIMLIERKRRTANLLIAVAGAILLGLRGFYSSFYLYITRTGHIDYTMTGRVTTWEEGWHVIQTSPWVGLGFQADRFTIGTHMHNAFLHVFIQSGIIGGGAILIGLGITWYYLLKYFIVSPPADRSLIPQEIPAVFLFVTISSLMESTFAYFSAAWLLSAPIVAYVLALHLHVRRVRAKAAWEKLLRWRLAQNGLPALAAGKRMEVALPPATESTKL
jgi:O-antigen ligase